MDQTLSKPDQTPQALASAAFDKAWRFVEADPILAHTRKTVLHSRLRAHLQCSIMSGERSTLKLANEAIAKLRAELAGPPKG